MIIAIEGIDGSGKTTQARMLVQRLRGSNNKKVRYLKPLFLILKERDDPHKFSPRRARIANSNKLVTIIMRVCGYIYAWLSYMVLRITSLGYDYVICDRYFYQFFFDLYDQAAEMIVRIFPQPDLLFYLEAEPLDLKKRMTDDYDRNANTDYYVQAYQFFHSLSDKGNMVVINALLEKGAINQLILEKVAEKRNGQ